MIIWWERKKKIKLYIYRNIDFNDDNYFVVDNLSIVM